MTAPGYAVRDRYRATARLRACASRATSARETGDRVALADARTSVADARIALNIACGIDLAEITSLGSSITRAAYERSRASWIRHLAEWPGWWASEHAGRARTNWPQLRPEWDDDWGVPAERTDRD